jgi:hypothetical protein
VKPPRLLVQAAAVGCSVLLAAGFVAFRAGAFDGLVRPTPAPVDPAPAAAPEAAAPEAPLPVLSEVEKGAIFSGSKSIIIAPVQPSPPGGSTAIPAAPTILPGSKSAPVFDLPGSKPGSPPPANPPK